MADRNGNRRTGYLVAMLLGVVGGGAVVALATRALPTIMARAMSGMMERMMARMRAQGHDPGEM